MKKSSLIWKMVVCAVIFILVSVSVAPSMYANESDIPEQSQSQLLTSIHKEFWRNPSVRKILFDSSKILQLPTEPRSRLCNENGQALP